MNKHDRKELQRAIDLIAEGKEIIDFITISEQDKFDNLSEGLQMSENGMKFEENSAELEEISSGIEEIIESIGGLI